MLEIERKFLVSDANFKERAFKEFEITQGYLNTDPERTTRVRTKGEKAFLTIKGKSTADGLSRFEWEKEIPVEEALQLLELCEPGVLKKTRHFVKFEEQVWEVDEFFGENKGLLLAEIELNSEDENVNLPQWVGEEVTGNKKYYNAYLSKHPFKSW